MAWIEPIFDRTQADVDYAIAKIAEWKKTGASAQGELKGCFNVSDINRIEGNLKYLSDELKALYYFHTLTTYKTWTDTGIPTTADVTRLLNKMSRIIIGYFPIIAATPLPSTLLKYTEVNALEENIYLIKEQLDDMVERFRECGTFECGEEIIEESNTFIIVLDSGLKGDKTYSQIVAARNANKRILGTAFNSDGTKSAFVFSSVIIYPNSVEMNGYVKDNTLYSLTCTVDNVWSSKIIQPVTQTDVYTLAEQTIRETIYDSWEGVTI